MTYRELLALYKTGKLDEEKSKEVEYDIEKQDAISEYLFEESKIPGFEDITVDNMEHDDTEKENSENNRAPENNEDVKFVSMIQRSIRKAFIKMGVVVGTVVLVLVLGAIFLLPEMVSKFYYDPTEIVGKGTIIERETDRMSLDLSVYSELFLPGYYRNMVIAESEGYGEYNIVIPQIASFTDSFTAVSGKLKRGNLTLYNTNILKPPTGNAFLLPTDVIGDSGFAYDSETGNAIGPAGTRAEAFEKLERLDENEWYMAYVSLGEITDYKEVYQWLEQKELRYGELWFGVYCEREDSHGCPQNIGFAPQMSGSTIDWDRETYPNLSLLDEELLENSETDIALDEKVMETHYISLLKYLRDHDDILTMMNANSVNYDARIQYVEKNGLQIYGFAIGTKKDTLLELSKDPKVSYIYTTFWN